MHLLRSTALALTSAALLGAPLLAQQNNASDRLLMARAMYYTPTTSGLHSFRCDVHYDWKAMLASHSKQPVSDDSPVLVYLLQTHMTTYDELKGPGSITFTNTAAIPDPDTIGPAIEQLQHGMERMFSGYYTSWNAYVNGTMVPLPDASTAIHPTADGGIELSSVGLDSVDLAETLDKNMLLTSVHVVQPDSDIVAHPVFTDTPDGRLVSTVVSEVHQPKTAPAVEVTFTTTYAQVGKYRLPSAIDYAVKNVASFHFDLDHCEINPK